MFRLQALACAVVVSFLTACGGSSQPMQNSQGTTQDSGGPIIPANAATVHDIQKLASWGSCSSNCAGEAGTNAIYSMQPGITSPALSGSAIQFSITGGTPWADALWWKQVGGNDVITHFAYEISYYLTDISAAQALEFNVNQNAGGWRYEYATQCDIRGSGKWRIWDHSQMHWVATAVSCPAPAANQWNQLTWEFERTADHKVVWVAVTLNGQRSVINQTFDAFTATGSGIDVAFQMDSDGGPTPWNVFVDTVNLSEW